MANARAANVLRIDTDDTTISDKVIIRGIKFIGGSGASTVTIKDSTSSGTTLYAGAATAAQHVFEDVCIKPSKNIHIALTGTGAVVYLYLK